MTLAVMKIGAARSLAAHHDPGAERLACLRHEGLIRASDWRLLRMAMPKTMRNPTSDPMEIEPPATTAATSPPTNDADTREAHPRSRRSPSGLQQQQPADHGGNSEHQRSLPGGLAVGERAKHLGVVLQRHHACSRRRMSPAMARGRVPPSTITSRYRLTAS
jgi:hypothetical protein